ncbi:hypothetical protein BDN72DRAFT_863757 [Pluteus cervinus]|uniref:Uncharacterized protein n=1 Tax=Pluteus cervinus TaxID=181527 RepID=A0ACD3A6C1_9AGAR|nr:hypothetical protein BDN72DRAFT_863757 [Pluteus cervinus]
MSTTEEKERNLAEVEFTSDFQTQVTAHVQSSQSAAPFPTQHFSNNVSQAPYIAKYRQLQRTDALQFSPTAAPPPPHSQSVVMGVVVVPPGVAGFSSGTALHEDARLGVYNCGWPNHGDDSGPSSALYHSNIQGNLLIQTFGSLAPLTSLVALENLVCYGVLADEMSLVLAELWVLSDTLTALKALRELARARAKWWEEEVILLQEEMRRVKMFLESRAKIWDKRADFQVANSSPSRNEGFRAFALQQAALMRDMKACCEHLWENVPQFIASQGNTTLLSDAPVDHDSDNDVDN